MRAAYYNEFEEWSIDIGAPYWNELEELSIDIGAAYLHELEENFIDIDAAYQNELDCLQTVSDARLYPWARQLDTSFVISSITKAHHGYLKLHPIEAST